MDNRPPREREGAFGKYSPKSMRTNSHSGNIAKETAHPSVGRSLSAGHHRLILPLCRLRLNAPPQDRLHRSNVTMLARQSPIYRTVNRLELFIRFLTLLCSPVDRVQSRLARLASHIPSTPCKPSWGVCRPLKTHRKRNSKQDHCPIMEKSARRSFSNGALFLALLCKPPPERIT